VRNCMRWLVSAVVAFSGWVEVAVQPAAAADSKPVAVLSLAPIESLIGDIAYLTEAAGSRDVGQMVEAMAQPYTQGIDRTRPIGVVLTLEEGAPKPLAFVPVSDLKATLASLKPQLGEPRDAGDGVLEMAGPAPVFIKEQGGFAFVGQSAEALADLPADPLSLLGGLEKDYDVGIRGHVQNVPQEMRDMAIDQLKVGFEQGLNRLPEEDDETFAMRKKLMEGQMQQMVEMINDTDQITLGWVVDKEHKSTHIDMTMTAVEGTRLARRMAGMRETKSGFTGFLLPDAAVTMSMAAQIPDEEIQQSLAMLKTVQANALKELDKDAKLEDEETRAAAKELVNDLFEVINTTIQSGKVDGGAAVLLAPGNMSALAGFYVADGAAVEKSLKKLVELAEKEKDFPGVQFDADKHANVRFHTMNVPIPEGEADARKVLGESLEVAVGIGETSVYLALGEDALTKIKTAIDSSASGAQDPVPPLRMNVSLGSIMKFAAAMEDNPVVATMAKALEDSGGKDHLLIHAEPVAHGVRYRIQVEEGILQAIGKARGGTP